MTPEELDRIAQELHERIGLLVVGLADTIRDAILAERESIASLLESSSIGGVLIHDDGRTLLRGIATAIRARPAP